jgi:GNAT superfamily N-acetyltransferase
MLTRHITEKELPELLRLYRSLHPEDPVLEVNSPAVREHWCNVLADANLRYYVVEEAGKIVSTCTLALVPNFTRGLRPYGVIENVVTDPAWRTRGCATAVLKFALAEAWAAGCYKVMLATGSREEATLRFYEKAGFLRGVKTGFIAYPPQP